MCRRLATNCTIKDNEKASAPVDFRHGSAFGANASFVPNDRCKYGRTVKLLHYDFIRRTLGKGPDRASLIIVSNSTLLNCCSLTRHIYIPASCNYSAGITKNPEPLVNVRV